MKRFAAGKHFALIPFQHAPLNKLLLEKLIVSDLVNEFATFYGTRIFITVFTRTLH
jgi:hypothetical protein